MDLLEYLKMLIFNFNFVMIYLIHKMSLLLENHLNYLKDSIFKYFLKEYNKPLFIYLFFYLFIYFFDKFFLNI